ncbi:MAG: hypothetical protein ACK50L_01115 [Bacteroidota bacterium]
MRNNKITNATHNLFAKDAASYSLNYFEGDYKAINRANMAAAGNLFLAEGASAGKNLYNGNIASMAPPASWSLAERNFNS